MTRSVLKYLATALGVVLLLLSIFAALLVWKWPWREKTVREALEKATGSAISIGEFHATYMPPGFVLGNIRVTNPDARGYPPVFTATGVTVSTSYRVMLSRAKRIGNLDIRDAHISIPPKGVPRVLHPRPSGTPPDFLIDHVKVNHAVLDFLSATPGTSPTSVEIHRLSLENATKNQAMNFDVAVHIPAPPAEIHSTGRIGPWQSGQLASTPVSGTYTLEKADLSTLKGVSGFVNARGNLSGAIGAITLDGTAAVPDFRVVHSTHAVAVSSTYHIQASVLTGDAAIHKLQAHWMGSTVTATGNLSDGSGRPGKTLVLDTEISGGRVEDLLILFTRHPQASMRGALRFHAHIVLPPKPPKFLRRIGITADFQIEGSRFSDARLQNLMNKLDRSAAGGKSSNTAAPLVLSDVSGHIVSRAGMATLSHVLVASPGSRVLAEGTFDLVGKAVDLNGLLQTQGKLSATTHGFKSLLLKAITPLWLHRDSVSDVPFRITGKSSDLHFALKWKRTSHL